eukprot:g8946.t1
MADTAELRNLSVALTTRLERTSWNAEQIAEMIEKDPVNFFRISNEKFPHYLPKNQIRLLISFSLLPVDLLEAYSGEIQSIIDIATSNGEMSKKPWIQFAAKLAGVVAKKKSRLVGGADKLFPVDVLATLDPPSTADESIDLAFCPRQYLYMETEVLPPLVRVCANRDMCLVEHFKVVKQDAPPPSQRPAETSSAVESHPTEQKKRPYEAPPEPRVPADEPEHKKMMMTKRLKKQSTQRYNPDNEGEGRNDATDSADPGAAPKANDQPAGSTAPPPPAASRPKVSLRADQQKTIRKLLREADPALLTQERRKMVDKYLDFPKNPEMPQKVFNIPLKKRRISKDQNEAQDEAENCDTRPIAYEFYANLQPLHPRFTVSPAKKPWAQPQPIASNSIAFPVAPNDVGEKKGGDGKE